MRWIIRIILLSPYGIPMVGAAVIGFLESINEKIRSI
ncbi:CD1845 family protein [Criibacterium bergeronii]|nr:CD1845 family protein [Criibacterium bergeronii]